ncbi:fibronectin type III domain-containing protein [Polaribacter sejongensis]|uniref:fibronectin type III domain-containing protein n=1 Tax=Polaribacter sejongensis TaxID=985043 RepID=UPI0035A70147
MKTQKSLIVLVFTILFGTLLQAQHTHDNSTTHTHYSAFDSIVAHKLIFPSSTPDRVIANLTVDAAHSLAVNWRTDQRVSNGVLEIALATDGPEFLLRNVEKINATSQKFENQNRNEPLVKATYHSAIVHHLKPNTIYVYRVGNGSKDNGYWSEWFQYKTANVGNEKPFSFIYFGDAQNNVKSLWSRVIRNSYRQFPQGRFYATCWRFN